MYIVFATPTGGTVRATHHRSKAQVQATCLQHTFSHAEVDLLIVSKARNALISALPPDADLVWFVDSDTILPPNAAELLTYIDKYPVVSGLYFARQPPHLPQVYNRVQPGTTNFAFLPLISIPDKPILADAVGAGCLLVRTEVLRELAEKHKAWQEEVREWLGTCDAPEAIRRAAGFGAQMWPYFEFLEQVGEDFYFCMQLQHFLGIRPLVVPSVQCIQESVALIGRQHFEAGLKAGQVNYSTTQAHQDRGVLAA